MIKLLIHLIVALMTVVFNTLIADTTKSALQRHELKYWYIDGWHFRYSFDGVTHDGSVDMAAVPEMHLAAGSVVDLWVPDDADVASPKFFVPIFLGRWLCSDVNVVYHFRGRILPQHTLICREQDPKEYQEATHAEISLDGKKLGIGDKGFAELEKMELDAWTFLHVRIIHEYRRRKYGGPGETYDLGGILHELKETGVKVQIYSQFAQDQDPWLEYATEEKKSKQ